MNSLISKIIDGSILNTAGNNNNNTNNNQTATLNNNSGSNASNMSNGANNSGESSPQNGIPPIVKPKLKYKHWCVQVEKKINGIQQLLPTLDSSLSSTDDKKKEKSTSSLQKINIQLQELTNLLEIISYKPSNKSTLDSTTDNVNSNNNNNNRSLTSSGSNANTQQQPNSPPSTSPIMSQLNAQSSSTSGAINITTTTTPTPNNTESTTTTTITSLSSSNGMKEPQSSPQAATTNLITTASNLLNNNNNQKNTRIITQGTRDAMLSIWGSMLIFLEKFYKVDKDFTLFYHCILLICKRKEFDSSLVTIDPITFKPWSKGSNDALSKYKEKLYKTYYFIAMSISNNNYLSIPLVNFSSRFLALAYFRIPKIAKLIIESLTPPETEIQDILSYFPMPANLKHLSIIGERPDKAPFHSILMQIPDNFSLDTISQGWVDNLARKEMTFFIFFKEWFSCCKTDALDIKLVPGFYPITYALLHELKTRDQCTPPLSKPTPALDAQYSLIQCCKSDGIIDTMVKTIFLKTCVFDLAAISATLGLVEAWFKEYGTLPDNFDINFFCDGIESIIAADHHQVLLRALQMIYTTSDCFQGNNRKVLFQDILLHKYFYHLFLHWDQPIRNAYHHILLYRMVRVKRSMLYQSGFSIGEYSKLTHNNTGPVTKQSLSPTKFIEGNKTTGSGGADHSYSSSSRLTTSTTSSIKPKSPRATILPNQTTTTTPPLSTSPPSSTPIQTNTNNNNNNKKVPPPLPPRTFLNSSLDTQNENGDYDEDNNSNNNNNNNEESLSNLSIIEEQIQPQQPQPRPKVIIPASLEKFSKDFALDIELFLEIEIYIKNVSDQFRSPDLKHHESRLSHYVASSLSEFKTYIAHNNQVDVTPPKIIPLMFANSPLNLANINANFRD